MAEAQREAVDGETPVNPYSLLEAVNRSSDTAHTAWLIFLGVMSYLVVAIAGVSHKDLLLQTPVSLPILQVQIQQVQFFQFAPILLVLFHIGVVSQLVLLARKTLEFDIAVRQLEMTPKRTHPLRLELHNFFFVQAVAGPHRSVIMGGFLHGMAWLTLVVLPVLLLLYIQVAFLPYHSVPITWTHRIALFADITMLMMIGVFLTRAETSFFQAFWRNSVHHPLSFLATTLLLGAVGLFSLLVATVPGEPLDRLMRATLRLAGDGSGSTQASAAGEPYLQGFVLPFLKTRADGSLFGLFHRNLIVTDNDLVVDKDVTAGEASLNLRGRDLRFARLDRSDLHQADFTGSNLDGASLAGADLSGIRLQCADITQVILGIDRDQARCASARGANFTRARLREAHMAGVDLSGAKLEEADLEGSELAYSILVGTNFSSALMSRADISGGVRAQGANFLIAQLQGADLTGAQLQFADFSSALMQGALLAHAQLQGAVLRDADLEGADLQKSGLHGADMTGAILVASDLREAKVWQTAPSSPDKTLLADLRGMEIAPLVEAESVGLRTMIAKLSDERVRRLVTDALRPVLHESTSTRWGSNPAQSFWQSALSASARAGEPDYKIKLAEHLAKLVCKLRWSTGSVATGVVRRAQGLDFQGDLPILYRAINSSECPARDAISKKLMREFTAALDSANPR